MLKSVRALTTISLFEGVSLMNQCLQHDIFSNTSNHMQFWSEKRWNCNIEMYKRLVENIKICTLGALWNYFFLNKATHYFYVIQTSIFNFEVTKENKVWYIDVKTPSRNIKICTLGALWNCYFSNQKLLIWQGYHTFLKSWMDKLSKNVWYIWSLEMIMRFGLAHPLHCKF